MDTRVHFSSNKQDWETPDDLFFEWLEKFPMTLDVCATKENTKLPLWRETDGLQYEWHKAAKYCWMNPPYGRQISNWIKKAYMESCNGVTTVALLPARTDTRWFHEYIYNNILVDIFFLKGRVRFKNAVNNAPFPSMIVIFKPN